MRYGLYYFLFFLFSFSGVKAQQGNEEHCASHTLHEKLLETDPTYAKQHIRNENEIQDLVQAMQASAGNGSQAQVFGDTLEIPVVVHVIHTGQNVGVGANISTAQINGAIEAINDRYRKTPNTHGDAAGVDTEIQFILAKRDPDCNATTGIVRVNGSSVTDYSNEGITAGQGSGADELEVKALSRWPATDYVNVWVVTEIENNNGGFGIQGYAYFPGVSPVRDGIIIMHSAFGVSGTVNSWNNLNRTFTHEVGHYLNLYHTFEGDNSGNNCPGTTNGCGSGSGDCCTDTEPHIRAASNCPTGANSCTSASWADVQHNYMNYSSQTCADMFSEDQSDRMRAALFGPRSSLLTSLGTEAPSSNTVASASCSPNTTNLSNGFGMGITNVTFENIDVNSSSAVGDSGYRDYSCHQMAEVFPSTTYSISINSGTSNDEDVRVYIDFNDDGDFLDANEFVFTNDTDTLHTGNIVIPSNPTLNTPLRMRVISDWQGNTAAMNSGESCYAPQYGQIEDYAVLVKGSMTASITGTEVSCNGGSDGTITVTVSSGTANYDYSWSNGASTSNSSSNSNTITGLAAGTYTVTVTDANSNTVAASHTIGEPSSPVSATITVDQMVSCFNGNDGQMTASASGGSGAFSFAWMNGSTSATISGLTAGTYTVTVTDANGCTDSESATITGPSSGLSISLSVDSNATCNTTGGISAIASGGTTAYTYAWSTGSSMSSITGLTAGSYTVTVTDANGCTDVESGTISQSSTLIASIAQGSSISCNGGNDGSLTSSATGGTAGYTYSWVTGGTTATQTNLAAGTYTVTVTDANGCTDEETFTLTEPTTLVVSGTGTNQNCSGSNGSATASGSGGTLPYSFVWSIGSSNATISSLSAGTYSVTATDANGCTDSAQVIIGTSGTGSSTTDSLSICNGDSFMVHGFMIGETGTYIDTITISGGCDSISTVIVTEGVGSYAFVIDWIYDGDSILLGGLFQTTSDIYLDTFPNNEGCDSIVETLLWVYPVQNGIESLTICQGDSALLGNVYRTTAGVYADTSIVAGTAVINSTTLFINAPQISSSNMNLNTGDSAFLAGSWRFVSGTYCDTIGACDTVNCVTLTVTPVTYVTFIDTIEICFGDSAFAGGTYQYNTGIYSDTVGNNSGVDSIFTTDLFVDPFNAINLIYSSGLYLKSNQLNPPFQWFDCDSQTVIATTQVGYYLPGYSGNFSSINQASVCGDTSSCVFHSNTANKTAFVVNGYPTSAWDHYTIVFDKSQNEISIDLFNIQGQLIQTWEESEVSQVTLPLGNVASGYYMVRIATLEGQQTLKFVKIID